MPAGERAGATLGAVVLHHRSWPTVAATLDALLAQMSEPGRVVVVDNASADGSVEHIRERYGHVEIVVASSNGGYAAGMNLGIRHLPREVDTVVLLTHECVLERGSLPQLVGRLSERQDVGIVGPLLVWSDSPDRVWSAGGVTVGPNLRLEHDNVPEDRSSWTSRSPRRVPWVDGACVVARRDLIDRLGGLDEQYFLYMEEADLMLRAAALGWVTECVPSAVARQSSAGLPIHLFFRNRMLFVRRHARQSLPVEVRQLVRRIVGLARHRHTRRAAWPALRGLADGLLDRTGPVEPELLSVRIDPEWREGLRLR